MYSNVIHDWVSEAPSLLVVGDGPFAAALAMITDSGRISYDDLESEAKSNESGGSPRVLDDLKIVFLVVKNKHSAADVLRFHRALWGLLKKLSSAGDQHEIAVVLILPEDSSLAFEETLAWGFGLEVVELESLGISFTPITTPLGSLIEIAIRTRPMDLPPLLARQASNERHAALESLRAAAKLSNPAALCLAAEKVMTVFNGKDHHLDLFCRRPCHLNGNLLRQWLRMIVTEDYTPHQTTESTLSLMDWLIAPEEHGQR